MVQSVDPTVISVVLLQISSGSTSVRTALVVNAVSEDDQTKALAAHQILVTVVAAVVPLLTSFVFGIALERVIQKWCGCSRLCLLRSQLWVLWAVLEPSRVLREGARRGG